MNINDFYSPSLATLPQTWRKSSFIGIGLFWIASNNFLTPVDIKIRRIREQGLIKQTFFSTEFDLLNCQLEIHPNFRILPSILRALATIGVFIFLTPMGALWHLIHSVYNLVLSSLNSENSLIFKEHIRSFLYDFFLTFMLAVTIYDIKNWKEMEKMLEDAYFHKKLFAFSVNSITCISLFILIMYPLLVLISPECLEYPAIRRAHFLKLKLGIISESGWLLTQVNSSEFLQIRNESGKISLNGYFYDLWSNQALDILVRFREAVELLKLQLPEDQLNKFAQDPGEFLIYLENLVKDHSRPLTCDRHALDQMVAQITSSFVKYDRGQSFLRAVVTDTRFPKFVFGQETCKKYFSYLNASSRLDNFASILEQIKVAGLTAGGPNSEFTSIKQTVLNANNAHEVLGVQQGASKEERKTAYRKCVIQIHPDRLPDSWKPQGEALFKVIDAAYRHLEK